MIVSLRMHGVAFICVCLLPAKYPPNILGTKENEENPYSSPDLYPYSIHAAPSPISSLFCLRDTLDCSVTEIVPLSHVPFPKATFLYRLLQFNLQMRMMFI